MKLVNDLSNPTTWACEQGHLIGGTQGTLTEDTSQQVEEPAAILELSFDNLNKELKDKSSITGLSETISENKDSGIEDASGRLTRMLVAARTKEEVYEVLSQAYKNLGDALMAAASGDEKAMDIVRRLNKLIRRANRKNRDLAKESEVRKKQKRAEKEKLEQLSRQLRDELKRKIAERKQREKKYLSDSNQNNKTQQPRFSTSIAALEAQLRMLEIAYGVANSSAAPTFETFSGEASGSAASGSEASTPAG